MQETARIFEQLGGLFVTPPDVLARKLQSVRAVLFDWDGVFNDGVKTEAGSSTFSEVDSMGTNLLRFGLWLHHNEQLPLAAIITGVHNHLALRLAHREHFQAVYSQAKHKVTVLNALLTEYNLRPEEVLFFFDDALDLSVAEVVGVRILIRRSANPLFTRHVVQAGLADYVTGHESGHFAVREGCELCLGLLDRYDVVMSERLRYQPVYERYYAQRQDIQTQGWVVDGTRFQPQVLHSL
jgi:3-deoxy-D-manno-octulosonate 8-phosphate phosphatase (KDO 8-P phosphatase)